ncbi:hypothetical protein PG997_009539 [Apiospora hydei]|uniref:Uncharacterized protein n=1 Tax=Apiospora hydei TaxID=1337664 RepID=A0ABR1VUE9_9PEZI
MDESNSATSATDGLPSRQQQQEQEQEQEQQELQKQQQQQLTQPPRGAHLLTSTTKSHRLSN